MGSFQLTIGVQQQVQPLVSYDPAEKQQAARGTAVGRFDAGAPQIRELANGPQGATVIRSIDA